MLELREVRKHYLGADGAPIRAVDGISLTVPAGELVALYGPSGSGKSTLLMIAAGITRPDAGSVLFDGRELASLSRSESARHRRTQLGFVFQSFRLTPGLSAIDNAALKLVADGVGRQDARRRAAPLLDRLGIAARAGQRVDALSRGERQRVAIARALANGPRLLLADEPTGSLDSRTGGDVLELIGDVCRERDVAVVIATHDPAAADLADHTYALRDGTLVRQAALPR